MSAGAKVSPLVLPFSHYAKLGYAPCPVEGKVPAHGTGWYEAEYSEEQLKALDASGLNVGLRCSNIVGIDIDITDERVAKKVEREVRRVLKLPKSTPRRVGKAPKALLICRVEEPMAGFDLRHEKRTVLFQLLGRGKQFVVHGTHPETKKPYTLAAPLPAHAKLPLVTQEQIDEMRATVGLLLTTEGYDVSGQEKHGGHASHEWTSPLAWDEAGMSAAWEALEKLDPDMAMDDWVRVGMAIHDGTHGSEEGLDLWDTWSQQASEKYKGRKDLARRWKGFKPGGGTTRATLFRNDFAKVGGEPAAPVRREAHAGAEGEAIGFDLNALLDADVREVPWLVDGLLTHGAHLLSGRPKGGKSWITLDMAFAVANGGKFLDRKAQRSRVLWIAGEDTHDSLARRVKLRNERVPKGAIEVMTMEKLAAERAKWEDCSFDAWLRQHLEANPDIRLVIMDTHATIEARWNYEDIEQKTRVNPVDLAYQKSRIYEEIGHTFEACIVLVHHSGKLKNNSGVDYHERINLPATVVAGATASLVLADAPDRDQHDEDDHQRVFAIRGRHIVKDTPLLIELQGARAKLLGTFTEVKQSETQAETLATLEALLAEAEPDANGERWVTYKEIARAMGGKHEKTISASFKAMKKDPAKLIWKGQRVVIKASRGVTLVAK